MNPDHAPRIFDVDDVDTALHRILPLLMGPRRQRLAVFAAYDAEQKALTRCHHVAADGTLLGQAISLDPARLHPLLRDDVSGHRPLRPADGAPEWAVRDLFRGQDVGRRRVRVRVIADDGRWFGVLALALPTGLLPFGDDTQLQTVADTLEVTLGRVAVRARLAELEQQHRLGLEQVARRSAERLQLAEREIATLREAGEAAAPKMAALEAATARATELLMETHVELAGRTERLRRQSRVLYLLRQLMDRYAEGLGANALADEVVRVVSEALGGQRCSLLLLEPTPMPRSLRIAAAQGLPDGVDTANLTVELGRGVSWWVAHHQTAMIVRDEADSARVQLVADEAYTGPAFASLPLTSNGRLLGVINVSNFRDGTFDDAELEMLRLIARCIALVVDHARLSERLFRPPVGELTR